MAVFGYRNVEVDCEFTGQEVTVPDNCYAKLMYYLHCVNYCAPGYIEDRLEKYRNYSRLSSRDKRKLVSRATKLSPDILENVIFFHWESLDGSNDFLAITIAKQKLAGVLTHNGISMVGKEEVEVTNIMLYRDRWMRKYYYEPLNEAAYATTDRRRNHVTYYDDRNYTRYADDHNRRNYTPDYREDRRLLHRSDSSDRRCCCTIL